ncbi:MAG: hypothetical protein LBQ54_05125 [Planctomycetaceae bacterium]|nr:hypothetical protein [Planctomycetaceae bacterium]
MSKTNIYLAVLGLTAVTVLTSAGCVGVVGPSLGPLSIPIPVSPSFQHEYENMAWEKERYSKVPIMDPIIDGQAHALDPPSDDEVMRALEKAHPTRNGVPGLETRTRNNVKIVKELIGNYLDPPREMPLCGPVQVHHTHYKCTVYYTEVIHVGLPIPYTRINEDAQEVVYIDHDHLHRVGNVDDGKGSGIVME